MPISKPIVGVDLGGTNINVGVLWSNDPDARVLPRSRVNKKTQAAGGVQTVIDRIADAVKESVRASGLSLRQIGAIGVGAAGAVDSARGVVLKGGNLGFTDVPLAAALRKRLGKPVLIENDVNAAVYGEWKHPKGAVFGVRDALGVWVGTGIGGGLVLNGGLYGGGFFTAGEIGHMTLFPGAPFGRSTLEEACSRTAISERLLALVSSGHPSSLKAIVDAEKKSLLDKARKEFKDKGKVPWLFEPNKILRSKAIAQAYRDADPLTLRVVHEAADLLGGAIAGVVTLLSLPHVVLGGGFTELLAGPWVSAVRTATRRLAFPDACKTVQVVGTRLKDTAGITGAALLARDARN